MSTENIAVAVLTSETAKAKINVALTQHSLLVQSLQNEADNLIINEDHLEDIKATIEKIKKAKKLIENKHEEIKKPYLEGGRACDAAKNELTSIYDGILAPLSVKYNKLCTDIETKKNEAKKAEEKKRQQLSNIDTALIEFSTKIAACTQRPQLNDVERLINLEKSSSRSDKYGEYHTEAIKRFDEVLIPAIKAQKIKVEDLEKLEASIKAAQDKDDVHAIDALTEKKEAVTNEILQTQVDVQEKAMVGRPVATGHAVVVHHSIPKGGRTDYEVEIVDLVTAFKKCPELLNITLKVSEAKDKARDFDDA